MAATASTETELGPSSDDSGSAPGDRKFRPDVEGLRAVAILLVVLYHGGVTGLSGGYVGVDVFFVISGFVITGVLLRERVSSGRTSLLSFYGRRARRIIPAATLVIVVTLVATYAVLGVVYGTQTATDARWTAVFLANFHFASLGTNYLTAQQPPSPLLNYWSLAVEEQFYLVYPTIFLLIAAVRTRLALRNRLIIVLGAIIVASFTLSLLQTATNPTVAYFSPFTRAWELALGALVAVGSKQLLGVPRAFASLMTWSGLVAIGVAAVVFNSHTPYPGSLVAIPVVGAALVIAGGVPAPRRGAESLLGVAPLQWLGKLSYSIYLWHWPLLVIAADDAGKTSLPFRQNVVWLLVALVASVATFRIVEDPIRHAGFLRRRRWAPIGLGVLLIVLTLVVASVELDIHGGPVAAPQPAPIPSGAITSASAKSSNSEAAVLALVRKATGITTLPPDLAPKLADVAADWGGPRRRGCWPTTGQSRIPSCVFGDHKATHTMVLYGDSHAGMWFDALNLIATVYHWKLYFLGKGYCPADTLQYGNPTGFGQSGGVYTVCDAWHKFALDRINRVHPDLVIVTQESRGKPDGRVYTPRQWQDGLEETMHQIDVPASRVVVLGNIPVLPQSGPQCLSRHTTNVQECSGPVTPFWQRYIQAEKAAALHVGARYINVIPWFCSTTCTAVIGKYEVYFDQYHVAAAYSLHLVRVLSDDLFLTAMSRPKLR